MGILDSKSIDWSDDPDIDIPGNMQLRKSGEENRKRKILAFGVELSRY